MTGADDDVTALPATLARYIEGMKVHDWRVVRASLADRFERIGPFPEHHFTDPDVYTQFLADLLPTLEGHSVEITRVRTIGDVTYVTIREGVRVTDTEITSYVLMACDLDGDGRITRIEVFLRRTA